MAQMKRCFSIALIIVFSVFMTACGGGGGSDSSGGGTSSGGSTPSSPAGTIIGLITTNQVISTAAPKGTVSSGILTTVSNATVYLEGTNYRATSDINGQVRLENVPVGTYQLVSEYVNSNGVRFVHRATVIVTENGQASIVATLRYAAVIYGIATLSGQSNHSGITVYIPNTCVATQTDANGKYYLDDVPEGTHTLAYCKEGYAEVLKTGINAVSAEITNVPDVLLSAGGPAVAVLTGTVTCGGVAIAGAAVSCQGHSTISGTTGSYRLTGLASGSYTVTCSRDGCTSQQATVNLLAGQTLAQSFALGVYGARASLSGTVENNLGVPVSLVQVTLEPDVVAAMVVTGAGGMFSINNIPPGAYTVTLKGTNSDELKLFVTLGAGSNVNLGTIQLTENAVADNQAPAVFIQGLTTVGVGQTSQYQAVGTDPDGNLLTYLWTVDQGTLSVNQGNYVQWTAPMAIVAATLRCTVSDGRENITNALVINVTAGTNLPPVVSSVATTGTSGDILLTYNLTDNENDTCSIYVDYWNGSGWFPATVTGSTSSLSPTTGLTLTWNSATDEPGVDRSGYRVRITPTDTVTGTAGLSPAFPLDNNAPPIVAGVTASGTTGDITVTYSLGDTENDSCSLTVEYFDGTWHTATVAESITNVVPGIGLTLTWRSGVDLVGYTGNCQIRITPADNDTGTAGTSALFPVDNNDPPVLTNLAAFGLGGDILLTFDLSDTEGDNSSISVEYMGGTTASWAPATTSGAISGLATGTGLSVYWRAGVDEAGQTASNYYVRITPSGSSAGTADTTGPLSLDNTLANYPPVVTNVRATGTTTDITITYDAHDTEGDNIWIDVHYIGGSVGVTWTTATTTGATGPMAATTNMTIVWNSASDELGTAALDYQIRITPRDAIATGTAGISPPFGVSNLLPERYALIVGIDSYAFWPSLPTCINDAIGINGALVEDTARWKAAQMSMLTDSAATRTGIRSGLYTLSLLAKPGDLVVYYQSSHGGTHDINQTNTFLATYDGVYEDYELAQDLEAFQAGVNVVIIIDACNSGGLFKGTPGDWKFAENVMAIYNQRAAMFKAPVANIGWITSSDYNEVSLIHSPAIYSEFTHYVMEAFRGPGDLLPTDGDLSFWELYSYAQPRVDPSMSVQRSNDALLTAQIAAAVRANNPPVITNVTGSPFGSGDAFIVYDLADIEWDPSDISVEYVGGSTSTWTSATVTGTTTGLLPSAGRSFIWRASIDEDGFEGVDYQVRITPIDSNDSTVGTTGVSALFSLDNNDAPVVSSVITTSTSADITIYYDLADTEGDLCDIVVEYGFASSGPWNSATVIGTTTGLSAAAGLIVTWTSAVDEPLKIDNYYIRITPYDPDMGTAGVGGPFAISNNSMPIVTNVVATGSSGIIDITYDLLDVEGDLCDLHVYYRGGTVGATWTAATVAGLRWDQPPSLNRTLQWYSQNDEGGAQATDYEICVRPYDVQWGIAGYTPTTFTIDNNTPPVVSNVVPTGTGGDIWLTFNLTDADTDLCDLYVEYRGGTVGSTWTTATVTGTLTAVMPAIGTTLVWQSFSDEPNQQTTYEIRITPQDADVGTTGYSTIFLVDNNLAPVVANVATTSTSGDIIITYDLSDAEFDSGFTIRVEYQGGSVGTIWTTATVSGATTGLSTGTGLTVTWHSATDEAGYVASNYYVRITPNDGIDGTAGTTGPLSLNNNLSPTVSNVVAPPSNVGDVPITFDLSDPENNNCDLSVEYQRVATGVWYAATVTGQVNNVPVGTGRTITWAASADVPGQDFSDFQIRITPSDGVTIGTTGTSNQFAVDNDYPPMATILGVTGSTGDITVDYRIQDVDNDICSIFLEYRGGSVGTTWTTATTGLFGTWGLATPGDYQIIWRSGTDEAQEWSSDYQVRVTPRDTMTGTPGESSVFYVSNNDPPVISITGTAGTSSDITVSYDLNDTEGDTSFIHSVEYRQDTNPSWTAATVSGTLSNISPPVVGNTFIWHSATDESGEIADYYLRVRPSDGHPGSYVTYGPFSLDNELAPTVTGVGVTGVGGNITITFTLDDPDGDPCDVLIEYIGGATAAWSTATIAGTTTSLTNGTYNVTWQSMTDIPGEYASDMQIRITPSDGTVGTVGMSVVFSIDNNTPPVITVITVPDGSNNIPITFDLTDYDGDNSDLDIQYQGGSVGTTWTTCTIIPTNFGIPPGNPTVLNWDSATDEPGQVASYFIRIIPHDAEVGTGATSNQFAVDNNSRPSVSMNSHVGTTGPISIDISPTDPDDDAVTVQLQYRGGPYTDWHTGFLVIGTYENLPTVGGPNHIIVWDTTYGLEGQPGYDYEVQVRVTDAYGYGNWSASRTIHVNNTN